MSRFRLRDAHPLAERFAKLCDAATELGLQLVYEQGTIQVTDLQDDSAPLYHVVDNDDHGHGNVIFEFPPMFDYRIVYEKDEIESNMIYLMVEKWRGSIHVENMQYFADYGTLKAHIATRTPDEWTGAEPWHVYMVFNDGSPTRPLTLKEARALGLRPEMKLMCKIKLPTV